MNSNRNKVSTIAAGEANFASEVLRSKSPVVVSFWAPWSRPCHILDSALNAVATACADSVKVVKVNADDNPDLSMMYEIQSIPTLLFFVDGNLRATIVGTASKNAILSKLQPLIHGGEVPSLAHGGNKENEHRNL